MHSYCSVRLSYPGHQRSACHWIQRALCTYVHSNMRRYASPHIQAYTYVSLLAMIFSATNSQKYAALRLGRVQWHTGVCALQLQTIIAAFKQQRSRPITPGSGQRILPYCFFFLLFLLFFSVTTCLAAGTP